MKQVSLRIVAAIALSFGVLVGQGSIGVESSKPLFFTPSVKEVPQVIEAIKGAKSSIRMIMFRISVQPILDELIAAHNRGVKVEVILDNNAVKTEKPNGAFARLSAAGVNVMKSSEAFSISHAKSFLIDNQTLFVMTLNLTSIIPVSRDVGYITNDSSLIGFYNELFNIDAKNSENKTALSPNSIPDNVVLAPGARDRLVALIGKASKSIKLQVENFSDEAMMTALIEAQKKGVKVQVVMPRCDIVKDDFDMPAARKLAAGGVDVRMMPGPDSAETPYIHQKSFTVDEDSAYLGSENFSYNSLEKARELGVIISERAKVRQLAEQFDQDYKISLAMADAETFKCTPRSFGTPTPNPTPSSEEVAQ